MTHKQKAEAGLLTAAMERCAADEGVQPEFIRSAMAAGAIVIPGNPLRRTRPVAPVDIHFFMKFTETTCVITSYSIHYTKLYDILLKPRFLDE